ncbi:MAG: STAS domain-containing protein [Vicinamibacterales bacterium]|nr:STAS domain-containing protein [Vicinamibacterales bacterium]
MAIAVTKTGDVVAFTLEGTIDGKAAMETEKAIATHVTGDVRFVIADMTRVQLLTSAGIRQFLLLRKRMASNHGGLVLCGVNERVRTLLEIAGLLSQFTITETREQALAAVTARPQGVPEPPPPTSRVGALLFSLLGGQEVASARTDGPRNDPAVEALVSHLDTVLGRHGAADAKPPTRP